MELLTDLLVLAAKESECVALFVICLLLLFALHTSNTRRLDSLSRKLREHTENCPFDEN